MRGPNTQINPTSGQAVNQLRSELSGPEHIDVEFKPTVVHRNRKHRVTDENARREADTNRCGIDSTVEFHTAERRKIDERGNAAGETNCHDKHYSVNHQANKQDKHDMVNHPAHDCQNTHDSVNHPAHYCQGGIECIDAIQAAVTGLTGIEAVCAGNVIKYTWRFSRKNGAEDLQKARFYLNKLIRIVEDKQKRPEHTLPEQHQAKQNQRKPSDMPFPPPEWATFAEAYGLPEGK